MAERDRLIDKSKTLRKLIGLFTSSEELTSVTPQILGEVDGEAFKLAIALPHQDFENVKYWGKATVDVPEILREALLIDGVLRTPVKLTVLIRRQRANPKTKILAEINNWRASFDVIREKQVIAVVSGEITPQSRFYYVLKGGDALPIFEGLISLGKEIVAQSSKN